MHVGDWHLLAAQKTTPTVETPNRGADEVRFQVAYPLEQASARQTLTFDQHSVTVIDQINGDQAEATPITWRMFGFTGENQTFLGRLPRRYFG